MLQVGKRRAIILRILVFLFTLNSITLFFYFSSQPHHQYHLFHPPHPRKFLTQHHPRPTSPKPWPLLPSNLPWTSNPKVALNSCEGYFGHGFNRPVEVLPKTTDRRHGWFRCLYSETLMSSVCEGGGVRMNVEKIRMSRGGEELDDVIGRGDEEELPEFDAGAFEIGVGGGGEGEGRRLVDEEFLDRYVPAGMVKRHTVRDLFRSIRLVGSPHLNCSQWFEEPALLVTRFEYANLFHTVTDWYSAYTASRVTGLPHRPHLIFVDGHCKATLEETWEALFSSVRYAKSFSGSVCFRHVIFSPLGYETALFKGLYDKIRCQGAAARDLREKPVEGKTARLSEFGEMIRAAFAFPVDINGVPKPVAVLNILFVRRENYLAHPRHHGKVESRLINEQEVFDSLERWLTGQFKCKTNLVNGLFAHMSMKEQIRAIQDASVIIGAHGAGLTHIVAATPETVILEIISSKFKRPHFALISQWKGLEYHAIYLKGSYAYPEILIKQLSRIMTNLGC